jgi:hypothetical protein
MYLLIRHADIVRYIKAQRISWIGHIVKMCKERTVKRITERRLIAIRRIGRPRYRWEDDVRANVEKMKIQNWLSCLRIEKHGRELMSRPKLTKNCSTKRSRSTHNLRIWSLLCDATLLDLESMKMVMTCSFKTLGTT